MGDASANSPPSSALFQPIQVGDVTLAHRVVLAPLTRFRANNKRTHTGLAVEYYAQRASFPGTLLITEAAYVSHAAEGMTAHLPGIWNDEQVAAWKRVSIVPVEFPCPSRQLTFSSRAHRWLMRCTRRVPTYTCSSSRWAVRLDWTTSRRTSRTFRMSARLTYLSREERKTNLDHSQSQVREADG